MPPNQSRSTGLFRIAYGLKGGRCNSDAIDNSAGVNTSDVEVNIKIALAAAM
ncbi:NAD-glutamate dehydrogenase domain-containing protein, partial [Rhizobium leguminosarum]|uniref:NAD-glutamate dehydrogenase domain-containing protein n=1 Tax=Rhizobium leguminosarum TaxID=384 RepID=UPI003F944D5A